MWPLGLVASFVHVGPSGWNFWEAAMVPRPICTLTWFLFSEITPPPLPTAKKQGLWLTQGVADVVSHRAGSSVSQPASGHNPQSTPHTALGRFTSADKPDPLQRLPSFLIIATGRRALALLLKIRTTNQ